MADCDPIDLEYRPWAGGPMPVAPDQSVDVMYRSWRFGHRLSGEDVPAERHRWFHRGDADDIIFWRPSYYSRIADVPSTEKQATTKQGDEA